MRTGSRQHGHLAVAEKSAVSEMGRVAAAVVLAATLVGCSEPSSDSGAEGAQVPGQPPAPAVTASIGEERPHQVTAHVTYRQRIILIRPVLHGRILDVTDPEAEIVIAEHSVTPLGGLPYEIGVTYEPDAIEADHAYVIEVQIKEMFKVARQPVITGGNPHEVRLDLTIGGPWVD